VYSRGLGPFFLNGTDHQAVVKGRAPRHRGVWMGRVLRVSESGVIVEPSDAHGISPLKPGDGVVFDAADWRSPEEPEEGGRIFQVQAQVQAQARGATWSCDSAMGCSMRIVSARGFGVAYARSDLDKAVRPYTAAATPVRKQAVSVMVTVREGEPLASEWRVGTCA